MKSLPIGIMQGRLLPSYEGRFQAFPAANWEQEFYYAQEIGLYCIEWIYEKPHESDNPLASIEGIKSVRELIEKTGIQVKSICADYYMTERLIVDNKLQVKNIDHLLWLLGQAKELDVTYIVLPFVDYSSLKNEHSFTPVCEMLRVILKEAEKTGLEIHLEADLQPQIFRSIFKEVNHPLLKMNYDIGNSASMGYDPDEEFSLLGRYLGSVHIKDRLYQGRTVSLGTGNADFNKCFKWFKKLQFDRWFILQAARGEDREEVSYIKTVLDYVNLLMGTNEFSF
jgi:L-ribulose-5-phosphate 3-epimerase